MAMRNGPQELEPFYGPPRGFSFTREIQPILDEAGDPLPQYLSDPANARRYYPHVEMLEALDAARFEQPLQRVRRVQVEAVGQPDRPPGVLGVVEPHRGRGRAAFP